MKIWVEEIWLKHTQTECKRLGSQISILSFNGFAALLTDGVKNQILEDILAIPAGCTPKSQTMDVCLSKPFKAIF